MPSSVVGLGRELRRALGDERVRLALESRALLAHVDHDLAPLAERIRDLPDVADRDAGAALAVLDAERVRRALVLPAALRDLAGQLVRLARLGAGQLARLARLTGGREARVHERTREQQGARERDDETGLALGRRVHRFPVWRSARPGRAPSGAGGTLNNNYRYSGGPPRNQWRCRAFSLHEGSCRSRPASPSAATPTGPGPPTGRRARPRPSRRRPAPPAAAAVPRTARSTPACAATRSRRRSRRPSAARTAAPSRPGSGSTRTGSRLDVVRCDTAWYARLSNERAL